MDQKHNQFLIKARRMVVREGNATWVRARVAQGDSLPLVELVEQEEEEDEEGRKLRGALSFLVGLGGPDRKPMVKDVFMLTMDIVMQAWSSLRQRKGPLWISGLAGQGEDR